MSFFAFRHTPLEGFDYLQINMIQKGPKEIAMMFFGGSRLIFAYGCDLCYDVLVG